MHLQVKKWLESSSICMIFLVLTFVLHHVIDRFIYIYIRTSSQDTHVKHVSRSIINCVKDVELHNILLATAQEKETQQSLISLPLRSLHLSTLSVPPHFLTSSVTSYCFFNAEKGRQFNFYILI